MDKALEIILAKYVCLSNDGKKLIGIFVKGKSLMLDGRA
jgi:hypothetical protein